MALAFMILFLIGRIMSGGFFVVHGIDHFKHADMLAGYAGAKGTPSPKGAVIGSGVLLLLGGSSLILGYHPTLGSLLLVIFLIGVSFKIHNFWTITDPQARMTEMIQFQKNMTMMAFLFMTLMIPRPWPVSLGELFAAPAPVSTRNIRVVPRPDYLPAILAVTGTSLRDTSKASTNSNARGSVQTS